MRFSLQNSLQLRGGTARRRVNTNPVAVDGTRRRGELVKIGRKSLLQSSVQLLLKMRARMLLDLREVQKLGRVVVEQGAECTTVTEGSRKVRNQNAVGGTDALGPGQNRRKQLVVEENTGARVAIRSEALLAEVGQSSAFQLGRDGGHQQVLSDAYSLMSQSIDTHNVGQMGVDDDLPQVSQSLRLLSVDQIARLSLVHTDATVLKTLHCLSDVVNLLKAGNGGYTKRREDRGQLRVETLGKQFSDASQANTVPKISRKRLNRKVELIQVGLVVMQGVADEGEASQNIAF